MNQPECSRLLDGNQIRSIADNLTKHLHPETDETARPLTAAETERLESIEIHRDANNLAFLLNRKFYDALLACARDYAFNRKSNLVELRDVKRAYQELTTD